MNKLQIKHWCKKHNEPRDLATFHGLKLDEIQRAARFFLMCDCFVWIRVSGPRSDELHDLLNAELEQMRKTHKTPEELLREHRGGEVVTLTVKPLRVAKIAREGKFYFYSELLDDSRVQEGAIMAEVDTSRMFETYDQFLKHEEKHTCNT